MIIHLPYGKTRLPASIPGSCDTTLIEPAFVPGLPDPAAALRAALEAPVASPALSMLARPGERVGIIVNDITRPTPNREILRAILDSLAHLPREQITLFNALGTHRANSEAELREMLGSELVDGYRIVQNDCFDLHTQVMVGRTSQGHEIWLNRALYECDLKILTGFIEPHFFAGFSGGGKAIMPGMAGQITIFANHSAAMIAHPRATWGVTDGNPLWEEVRECALSAGRLFLVNVTLNRERQITGVFCGDLQAAHAQGCAFVRQTATVPVSEPFDIVLTTNSGYPLDQNLYQTVKGMCAAAQVVRPGGAIVIASQCCDGLPEHGLYARLLRAHSDPRALLADIHAPGPVRHDQWEAQLQAQVLLKAEVYLYSDGLSDEQVRGALLQSCHNIEATLEALAEKYGPRARLCLLPEGPQTIPYLV